MKEKDANAEAATPETSEVLHESHKETEARSDESSLDKSDVLFETLEENKARSEESVLGETGGLDEPPKGNVAQNKIEQGQSSVLKLPSLLKILIFATLVAGLLISVLLNISLLSNGGETASSSSSLQWVVIAGAFLITAVSLGISFWLYYVRSIYLKDGLLWCRKNGES